MAEKHFYEQKEFTKKYLLPYFQKSIKDFHRLEVLEIGCAEGGLLEVLRELGMSAMGVELSAERIEIAKAQNPELNIIQGDVTDPKLPELIGRKFDLIIMREVIEHVHDKYSAFDNLDLLLNSNGYLFISFPPKYSPFAGHQQIARSLLKIIPYIHLFPAAIVKLIAKFLSEKEDYVDEIKLHYSTGMEIAKFETLCMLKKFILVKKELFLFRPIYGYRYGLPILKLPDIRFFREFYTFGYETLLRKIG